MRQIKKLSIVFSFRNEQEVLRELISRTRSVMQVLLKETRLKGYELVFVNDASDDSSLNILLELARNQQDIKIINLSRRFGVSVGVLAGLKFSSGDAVIYMDADLQDPPEIIPELVASWNSDPQLDIIHTMRRSRRGEPRLKLLITRIGYLILHQVSSIRLPIECGDFKLLSRRVVDHLLTMKESNPFMRGLVCWTGFKQIFVSYDREERKGGKGKFPIFSFSVINNFFESALISFSSLPLRLTSYIGFSAIFVNLALLIHVFGEKIQGKAIPGWTAIMFAIVIVGGIQLFILGIIGLYLRSIFENVQARPAFIVTSAYGFDTDFLSQLPNLDEKHIVNLSKNS